MEELRNIKSTTRELREFGVTMAAILIVLGDVAMWRGRTSADWLLAAGAVFCILGLAAPAVLKPLQKAWMGLGLLIGFFVSRIVLSALFYGIITPIGLIMRLAGKDILGQAIDKDRVSYWHERPSKAKPLGSYENQY